VTFRWLARFREILRSRAHPSSPARARLFDADAQLVALAGVLLIASAVLPPLGLPRKTFDYIVIFDISQSMGVEDYDLNGAPISRLDIARAGARKALRELPCGSRVGWGVFAEYRTLLLLSPVEVCENYNDLLAALDNVDGRMRWGNSSEITKGIFWSMRTVKEAGGSPTLLFLTDGQEAPPLDPTNLPEMFEDLKRGEAPGWLVGVGGDTPRRIPKVDEDGRRIGYWQWYEVLQRFGGTPGEPDARPREHLSQLREAHLRDLAQKVGLDYARLIDQQSISTLMHEPRFARRTRQPTDVGWIAAALALLLLAIRFRPMLRPNPLHFPAAR
jgi:mxaL protein